MMILTRAMMALLLAASANAGALAADLDSLLAQMRNAHGGAAWNGVAWLRAEGVESGPAGSGKATRVVDRATGQFVHRATVGRYTTAEGLDGRGRWRQGRARGAHSLDSDEARAVAASESWLHRFGFADARDPARWTLAGQQELDGVAMDKLEATPPGGRAVTLLVDPATHLVRQARMKLATSEFVEDFADYRPHGKLMLPARIDVAYHGGEDRVAFAIAGWSTPARLDPKMFARPGVPADARIAGGAASATVPIVAGRRGVVVRAMIDGHGPYNFILDTGAYAILGEKMADKMGLKRTPAGVTIAVGGALPTTVSHVGKVKIGAAEMSDIPFMVHDMPDRFHDNGDGEPIVGFLGLELFERFAVRLDMPNGRMTLTPLDQYRPGPAQGEQIPIRFSEDAPLATGKINGHAGDFVIDIGNIGTVTVQGKFARRHGLDKVFAGGREIRVQSAAETVAIHYENNIDRVEIGNLAFEQVKGRVAYDESGPFAHETEAANIGYRLFKEYDVTFDYKHQTMTVSPPRKDL